MISSTRRVRAWLALVAFTATFGFGQLITGHFGPDDDAACGRAPLAAGHSTVQFETAKSAPLATHCVFCHWQRAVAGASVLTAQSVAAEFHVLGLLIATPSRVGGSTAIDERPSRAPPA